MFLLGYNAAEGAGKNMNVYIDEHAITGSASLFCQTGDWCYIECLTKRACLNLYVSCSTDDTKCYTNCNITIGYKCPNMYGDITDPTETPTNQPTNQPTDAQGLMLQRMNQLLIQLRIHPINQL